MLCSALPVGYLDICLTILHIYIWVVHLFSIYLTYKSLTHTPMTIFNYNQTIRYLGYRIQIDSGIVYPSKGTVAYIDSLKLELSNTLNKFKAEHSIAYADSIPVSYYT